MKKLILNMAISLDGYISDKDGGFDWIVGQNDRCADTTEKLDFNEFLARVDTVVMGSKSYEDTVLTGLNPFKDKRIVVFTTRQLKKVDNAEFVSGDIAAVINALKDRSGKDIFLFGGAVLVDKCVKANLIDEYIIGIIPIILGEGRRLFDINMPTLPLKLSNTYVDDGIVIMHYTAHCV